RGLLGTVSHLARTSAGSPRARPLPQRALCPRSRRDCQMNEEPGRRGLVQEYTRPGSAYVVSREFPPRPGSAAQQGSSLSSGSRPPLGAAASGFGRPAASRGGPGSRAGSRAGSQSRPIDILEDEEAAPAQRAGGQGLRGLDG
ncbi:unnamed protein product, partial [Prorocentrum cordatum]